MTTAVTDSAAQPTPAARAPRRPDRPGRRPLRATIALLAAVPLLAYVWVALHRVGYGFELDWMEGGSVELAARVAAGHSLYVAPTLHYVGWTYTPLYYWLSAAVAQLTGVGFLPLRLVSLIASIASMAILGWVVCRETGDRVAGAVAAGLFAATFEISGAWFDTGRVDSLFLALTLAAVAWGRRARGVRGGVALGVIAFAAFFTKQIALVALLPLLAYLAFARRRVGVSALLTLVALVLGSTALLDALSDGWYRYYVISELAGQGLARQLWVQFWTQDLVGHEWPSLIVIVVAAGVGVGRAGPRVALGSAAAYYAVAAAGLIGAAWFSRVHTGGYANVLIPAYAAVALLAGLAVAHALSPHSGQWSPPLTAAALAVQLVLLAYPLSAQLPTAADRTAGAQLLTALRALPGEVLVLRHPWYATELGKGSFAQGEGITDVLRSDARRGRRALEASLAHALDDDRIRAVVLDGTFDATALEPALSREFRLAAAPITAAQLYPLTDVRSAPTLLYLRVGTRSEQAPRVGGSG
jgi:hypothetical protein